MHDHPTIYVIGFVLMLVAAGCAFIYFRQKSRGQTPSLKLLLISILSSFVSVVCGLIAKGYVGER